MDVDKLTVGTAVAVDLVPYATRRLPAVKAVIDMPASAVEKDSVVARVSCVDTQAGRQPKGAVRRSR